MIDLVQLLAAAPPWARAVVSFGLLVWGIATLFTNALRAVPEARFVALERGYPRAGQLARAGRKFGSDFQPFVGAVVGAMLGIPVRPEGPRIMFGPGAVPSAIEAEAQRWRPPGGPQSGAARPAVLLWMVVGIGALGFASLLRCHPQLPPVSGCVPGTWSCAGDMPTVCSPTQRWEVRGDEPCGAVPGRTCVVTDGGARCRTPRDGGVSDAE